MMDTVHITDCRICGNGSGQYNIFSDELCFDMKSSKKTKIFKCLNDFLFEKLYGEDEHSSFLCQSCCDSLCDSYAFMIFVRKTEQNSWKIIPEEILEPKEEIVHEIQQEVPEEELISEEFEVSCDDYDHDDAEILIPDRELEIIKSPKRPKICTGLPESIQVTHYELHKDKNIVFVNIEEATMRPKNGKYVFDLSFLNHRDDSLIYQCKFCIKAFSSSEFLVKHVCSVHICTLCLEVLENYKTLTKHVQSHKSISCPFDCGKVFETTAAYRLHLKKTHSLLVPPQIGILPGNLK